MKQLIEKKNKDCEELKCKIQKIFTKIRSALNEKEDKLLLEVDEKFNEIYIKDDIIKESEKLPNKIKISLEKGKKIEKEWNDNNLNLMINNCINFENNIKEINKINYINYEYQSNKDIVINFSLEEDTINQFIDKIKSLGEIITKADNDILYKDFDIKLKEPKGFKGHSSYVWCLTKMNDGRLASGSRNGKIIIYNEKTYQPDIIMKEHNDGVCCIIQLNNGILASCSMDNTIKLFTIDGKNYKIVQELSCHKGEVYKIIELKNKSLVSCSKDSYIKFYLNNKSEYKEDFSIKTNGCISIIQIKENELC